MLSDHFDDIQAGFDQDSMQVACQMWPDLIRSIQKDDDDDILRQQLNDVCQTIRRGDLVLGLLLCRFAPEDSALSEMGITILQSSLNCREEEGDNNDLHIGDACEIVQKNIIDLPHISRQLLPEIEKILARCNRDDIYNGNEHGYTGDFEHDFELALFTMRYAGHSSHEYEAAQNLLLGILHEKCLGGDMNFYPLCNRIESALSDGSPAHVSFVREIKAFKALEEELRKPEIGLHLLGY